MPSSEWADLHVGDRVEVLYRGCAVFGCTGTVIRMLNYGARVMIDGEEHGFSERTSLKRLGGHLGMKRPVSPIFYAMKEPSHVVG